MISILTESIVKIVRMTLPSISPVFRIPCTLHLIVNVTHVTTVAAAAIAADAVQLFLGVRSSETVTLAASPSLITNATLTIYQVG